MRCSAAKGSSSGISLGGPTKVKPGKSFLFTEGSLTVENKEHSMNSLSTTMEDFHQKEEVFRCHRRKLHMVGIHSTVGKRAQITPDIEVETTSNKL